MKKSLLFIFLVPVLFFSQLPNDYYKETEGLSGYALKSKLHEILSKKNYTKY